MQTPMALNAPRVVGLFRDEAREGEIRVGDVVPEYGPFIGKPLYTPTNARGHMLQNPLRSKTIL